MANLELLYYDHVENWNELRNISPFLNNQRVDEIKYPCEKSLFSGQPYAGGELVYGDSEPWTATAREQLGKHAEAETETSFTCKRDGDPAHVMTHASPIISDRGCLSPSSSSQLHEEEYLELFMLADDDLGSEKSVDYGFIIGVICLATGISLVAISYTVPRGVRVDPDSVSAREMEKLEVENARVGDHLDRCVIAGLCLLTLGGVLLAMLLMVSMWKGEMIRRKAFAYSKHAAKLYGSINLKAGRPTSPSRESSTQNHFSVGDGDLEVLS